MGLSIVTNNCKSKILSTCQVSELLKLYPLAIGEALSLIASGWMFWKRELEIHKCCFVSSVGLFLVLCPQMPACTVKCWGPPKFQKSKPPWKVHTAWKWDPTWPILQENIPATDPNFQNQGFYFCFLNWTTETGRKTVDFEKICTIRKWHDIHDQFYL